MKTVCDRNKCTACGLCVEQCSQHAVQLVNDLKEYYAVIDENKCVECGRCNSVCQINHPIELIQPKEWYQGWASNKEIHKKGASGGIATAISIGFIRQGGIVVSCTFKNGEFIFEHAESETDIMNMSGSKYVKSNPVGIYQCISAYLNAGKQVLFIGLPCQVAAVKKSVREDLLDKLYTVDIICHGTPSSKALELYLENNRVNLSRIDYIGFRNKSDNYQNICSAFPKVKTIRKKGISDWYTIAFLKGISFTENCYECQYAQTNRCGDVSLGDSWGTELNENVCKDGVSLVLEQTEKGHLLLHQAEVTLLDVDISIAIANNNQLRRPTKRPKKRKQFFYYLSKSGDFNRAVRKTCIRECLKQDIKFLLSCLGIEKTSGGFRYNYAIEYGEDK